MPAEGPVTTVAVFDFYAEEWSVVGVQPWIVEGGSQPDVAVIMAGRFAASLPGLAGPGPWPYARTLVDRADGTDYGVEVSGDVGAGRASVRNQPLDTCYPAVSIADGLVAEQRYGAAPAIRASAAARYA